MRFTAKQYAQSLYEVITTTKPEHQDLVLDNFVKILAENSDLKLYDQIAEEFHKLELADQGKTLAQVTSARPLGSAAEKQIIKELNQYLDTKVELKKKIDENLIGGVVIQVEDTLIDASVRNSLQDLENNLGQ